MATVVLLRPDLSAVKLKANGRQNVLGQVTRLERQVFPKTEAMDFEYEMRRRNQTLTVVVDDQVADTNEVRKLVLAYMLFSRAGSTTTVHKLCVAEQARRQGIARKMLNQLKDQLSAQGGDNVQLCVDKNRWAARALYASLGFQITSHLPDYYRPGRDALRMKASTERLF